MLGLMNFERLLMKKILEKYIGKSIGINCKNPDKFQLVTLTNIDDTHFTVKLGRDLFHFPLQYILSIAEPEDGVKLDGPLFDRNKAAIAVTVYHLIIYKGAFGISFGTSI